jgi:subtilisin family serine protease
MNYKTMTIMLSAAIATFSLAQRPQTIPFKAEAELSFQTQSRSVSVLGPSLQSLFDQAKSQAATPSQLYTSLCHIFGIDPQIGNPKIVVTVFHSQPLDPQVLSQLGADLIQGGKSFSTVALPLETAEQFAMSVNGIKSIDVIPRRKIPPVSNLRGSIPVVPLPNSIVIGRGELNPSINKLKMSFDTRGATGKNTVVAVLDTGIDFRHEDFLKPNGDSRIAYLYDMSDPSFEESNGQTGTQPPFSVGGKPLGTLYTKEQLNKAIKNNGEVNSYDYVGHGTACTSIAAGTKLGLAPEADIIFVKIMQLDESGAEYIGPYYHSAATWVKEVAAKMGKPVAMSMSFGGHYSNHDGTDADELAIDALTTPETVGVSIAISAGNDGQSGIQANSKFGKNKSGQIDRLGDPVQAIVSGSNGALLAKFSTKDHWGIQIIPRQPNFEIGNAKRTIAFNVYFDGKNLNVQPLTVDGAALSQSQTQSIAQTFKNDLSQSRVDQTDRLFITLPRGEFWIAPFGYSETVDVGKAQFYGFGTVFGYGGTTRYLVGSPGNATNAITVAAHVGINEWDSLAGAGRKANLKPGEIAAFSSPGPRADGFQKPDIAAPGHYLISALSSNSVTMGKDGSGELDRNYVTPDGKYLAWSGTSASTPYVAGIISLMMEINPQLTSGAIKKIIHETATKDAQTGQTPNPVWGYGKINGVKALESARKTLTTTQKLK